MDHARRRYTLRTFLPAPHPTPHPHTGPHLPQLRPLTFGRFVYPLYCLPSFWLVYCLSSFCGWIAGWLGWFVHWIWFGYCRSVLPFLYLFNSCALLVLHGSLCYRGLPYITFPHVHAPHTTALVCTCLIATGSCGCDAGGVVGTTAATRPRARQTCAGRRRHAFIAAAFRCFSRGVGAARYDADSITPTTPYITLPLPPPLLHRAAVHATACRSATQPPRAPSFTTCALHPHAWRHAASMPCPRRFPVHQHTHAPAPTCATRLRLTLPPAARHLYILPFWFCSIMRYSPPLWPAGPVRPDGGDDTLLLPTATWKVRTFAARGLALPVTHHHAFARWWWW